jgi:hypothetical protein
MRPPKVAVRQDVRYLSTPRHGTVQIRREEPKSSGATSHPVRAAYASDIMRTLLASLAAFTVLLAPVVSPPNAAAATRGSHGCLWTKKPSARAGHCPTPRPACPARRAAGSRHGSGCVPTKRTVARLFAADSVWNAPLAPSAPLDPTSRVRMAAFNVEVDSEISRAVGPWISESSYSTPLYKVPANQRKVSVALDTGSWRAPLERALKAGVPIPNDAHPAAGTDGHLTIWQPSTDTLWEFWKAVKQADGWHASWGGAMQRVSRNPGYYTQTSWAGLSAAQGWNWGSTATSLPVIAGTVMIDELRRARIGHALAVAIPDACAGTFSWPAQRTDGSDSATNCLPEGAHLRLDPNLDLATLSLPPITRMLAEAAQRYGLIVRDRTSRAVGFYAEDPTRTGTDPYLGADGLYGGLRPWSFLPQFPWDRLQLLKMTLCRRAPCLPTRENRSASL